MRMQGAIRPDLEPLMEAMTSARSALLVVDMQYDFCDPAGKLQSLYRKDSSAARDIVAPIAGLVDAAHAAGVPVLFTQMTREDATESPAFAGRRLMSRERVGLCDKGSAGAEFWGIRPGPGDTVVEKHRQSAFHGTDLDLRLRSLGRDVVVITGVATNVCVETTARDACAYNYWSVVVSDATGAYSQREHEAALYNIENYFGWVAAAADVLACWKAPGS
jgi:ureidoacrylate peracid hydrolase